MLKVREREKYYDFLALTNEHSTMTNFATYQLHQSSKHIANVRRLRLTLEKSAAKQLKSTKGNDIIFHSSWMCVCMFSFSCASFFLSLFCFFLWMNSYKHMHLLIKPNVWNEIVEENHWLNWKRVKKNGEMKLILICTLCLRVYSV